MPCLGTEVFIPPHFLEAKEVSKRGILKHILLTDHQCTDVFTIFNCWSLFSLASSHSVGCLVFNHCLLRNTSKIYRRFYQIKKTNKKIQITRTDKSTLIQIRWIGKKILVFYLKAQITLDILSAFRYWQMGPGLYLHLCPITIWRKVCQKDSDCHYEQYVGSADCETQWLVRSGCYMVM